jgi:hypothetical protein
MAVDQVVKLFNAGVNDFRLVIGVQQLNIFDIDTVVERVKIYLNHQTGVVSNEVQSYLFKPLKLQDFFFLKI